MADGILQTRPGFDEALPSDPVMEQYPSASWQVGANKPLVFPALEIQEEGGNRIVQRERPYRDGAKIDDIGSRAKCWTFRAYFENSIDEGARQNGMPLYPDVLNALIRSFDLHETGDLIVPTVGKVRARAQSYVRVERNEERDTASLELKFIQDNEDKVDATAFAPPTVKASMNVLKESAVFSAHSDGIYSLNLADLNEFAQGLIEIANFPGTFLADVDSKAGIVVGATNRVLNAFTSKSNNPKTKARAMLSDPDASVTARKLTALQDTSARAVAELRENQPAIIRILLDRPFNIFDIAVQYGQDVNQLIAINSEWDPFAIPAGATIRIFDT